MTNLAHQMTNLRASQGTDLEAVSRTSISRQGFQAVDIQIVPEQIVNN